MSTLFEEAVATFNARFPGAQLKLGYDVNMVIAFKAFENNVQPYAMEEFLAECANHPPGMQWKKVATVNIMERKLTYTPKKSLRFFIVCENDNGSLQVFFTMGPTNFMRCDKLDIKTIQDFNEVFNRIDTGTDAVKSTADKIEMLIARIEKLHRDIIAMQDKQTETDRFIETLKHGR